MVSEILLLWDVCWLPVALFKKTHNRSGFQWLQLPVLFQLSVYGIFIMTAKKRLALTTRSQNLKSIRVRRVLVNWISVIRLRRTFLSKHVTVWAGYKLWCLAPCLPWLILNWSGFLSFAQRINQFKHYTYQK